MGIEIFETSFEAVIGADADFRKEPFEELLPVVDDGSWANDEILILMVGIFVDDSCKKSHRLVCFTKSHIIAK